MIQFFAFGSSSTYGVGAEQAGWADLLKQRLHQEMYAEDGVGEKYEFFNFGKSGATISFVQATNKDILENYGRDCQKIALVSVGGNNSKAEDEPDNFVSTPEEFQAEMTQLLTELQAAFDSVLFVGGGYVDESKTNPKPNPLTGGKSYFSNGRRAQFDAVLVEVCKTLGVTYIELGVEEAEWIATYEKSISKK